MLGTIAMKEKPRKEIFGVSCFKKILIFATPKRRHEKSSRY